MNNWQPAEWLAAIAIVVSVAAIVVGVWAARRFGTRRGKLLVAHTSTRLLGSGSLSNHLNVTFRNHEVPDPHLVSLLLKNIGPKDITREQFDGGKFRVKLQESRFYGLLQVNSSDGVLPDVQTAATGAENGFVEFQPTLLPKGVEWTVEAIVSGPAEPKISGRLVDTDIVDGETRSETVLKALVEYSGVFVPSFGLVFRLLGELLGSPRSGRR